MRAILILSCSLFILSCVPSESRAQPDLLGNLIDPIKDVGDAVNSPEKVLGRLKKIDPTMKESSVRKLLREIDSETIVPIVAALKQNLVPGMFDQYMLDLERQAAGKKQPLPGWLRDVLKRSYSDIDLSKVRYATNINTWHGQGITIGYNIYFPRSITLNNRDDLWWMLHELEHVSQYEAVGGVSQFLMQYVIDGGATSITCLNNGCYNVHDCMELERSASKKANGVLAEVERKLDLKPSSGLDASPGAIVDIRIIAGDSRYVKVPLGYWKNPVDLNWGARGKYIYLCYRRSMTDPPITDVKIITGENSDPPVGYKKDRTDLNWGAKGKYIYLTYTRDPGRPVVDIQIVAKDSANVRIPAGFVMDPTDLNGGSGGKYIYLCTKKGMRPQAVQPPPNSPSRTLWKYDGGSFRDEGNGNWVERNTNATWRFKETQRTAEYVDLYDSSRGYSVRLRGDTNWIKGGNDRVRKFADWTQLGRGKWVASAETAQPPPIVPSRTLWQYNGGSFKDEGNGNWVERNGPVTWRFKLTQRTAEYIELYDSSRGYSVRLRGDTNWIKGGNEGVRKFADWTQLGRGKWVVAGSK